MTRSQTRRVYIGFVLVFVLLFAGGALFGYTGRHTPICEDGKPPLQQHDTGIGQVAYLCHDGTLVTK
ncbi:MAG: hypothetical protein WCH31_07425 [Actinomycetes bacterium]